MTDGADLPALRGPNAHDRAFISELLELVRSADATVPGLDGDREKVEAVAERLGLTDLRVAGRADSSSDTRRIALYLARRELQAGGDRGARGLARKILASVVQTA
jgi:hypothetical protein